MLPDLHSRDGLQVILSSTLAGQQFNEAMQRVQEACRRSVDALDALGLKLAGAFADVRAFEAQERRDELRAKRKRKQRHQRTGRGYR